MTRKVIPPTYQSDEMQERYQQTFMAAAFNYGRSGVKDYHDALPVQREGLTSIFTENSKLMTSKSLVKVLVALEIQHKKGELPDYRGALVRAMLEEKTSTVAERRQILVELNDACQSLTNNNIRDYLGEKDKTILRELTTEKGPEGHDAKGK